VVGFHGAVPPSMLGCYCDEHLHVFTGLELGDSDEDVCPTCLEAYTDGAQPAGASACHPPRRRLCRMLCRYSLKLPLHPEQKCRSLRVECTTSENPRIESKCGHHFHLGCIFEWLNIRQTCPVCSRKMEFEELL
jgi:RING-H2 zinc finger domain